MRGDLFAKRLLTVAAAPALIVGCRGAGGVGSPVAIPAVGLTRDASAIGPLARNTLGQIKHIVIVIQENRTVENLFYGYPNAKTVKFGHGSNGQKILIQQVSLATTWDLEHNANSFFRSCNGTGPIPGTKCRMNGFDKIVWYCGHGGSEPLCPIKYPPYGYVPHEQIQPYLDMAHQYVFAAQMFASDFDLSSFISHQYMVAGINPNHSADVPTLQWGCPGGPTNRTDELLEERRIKKSALIPCWTPNTLGRELDAAGRPWAYYAEKINDVGPGGKDCGGGLGPDHGHRRTGIWSAYQAIKYICYGRDWANVIPSPAQFLTDVKAGRLRSLTWVTPRFRDSDHPGNGSDPGPSWVAHVVNAIGESQFWDSTAIFIFWDDPGGWYDPEPPAYVDNDSLGFRLPMLIISPYAKKGYVSQVPYEHGSILKFIEDTFGLPRLNPQLPKSTDIRATSPEADCFDFLQPPRTFVPITAKYPESYFLHEQPDDRRPDTD
jgi:phospholipase C